MAIISIALAALLTVPAEAEGPRAPRPTVGPQNWFTEDDYPIAAIEREAEGIVGFQVQIDARGVPTDCKIQRSSNDPDLDRATCEVIMARTRFYPALDSRDRPVAGAYRSRVRWILPDAPPESRWPPLPFATGRLAYTIRAWPEAGSCAATGRGPGFETVATAICGLDVFATMGRPGEGEPFATFTMVIDIVREGEAALAPAEGQGRRGFVSEAEVEVAPDGAIAACRLLREEAEVPSIRPFPRDAMCEQLRQGPPTFVSQAQDAAPRRGRIRLTAFIDGPAAEEPGEESPE